jgi:predicted Zn-dependent protease
VIVDRAELQIGDHDIEDMEKTMCHEVGHSVGLTHGGNTDCMLNGEIPSTSIVWRTYDSHHKSHINAAY